MTDGRRETSTPAPVVSTVSDTGHPRGPGPCDDYKADGDGGCHNCIYSHRDPARPTRQVCEWRTHYFRGPRCTCGAFTMNDDGSLTENAYDPLPTTAAYPRNITWAEAHGEGPTANDPEDDPNHIAALEGGYP